MDAPDRCGHRADGADRDRSAPGHAGNHRLAGLPAGPAAGPGTGGAAGPCGDLDLPVNWGRARAARVWRFRASKR